MESNFYLEFPITCHSGGTTRPRRKRLPRVEIPREEKITQKIMDTPPLATSDYVRRTMVIKIVNGVPTFEQQENPSDIY